MSYREEAEAALRAGQNADIGDRNPYNGTSLVLAKLWRRGYQTMLTVRCAATPAMQKYLQGRPESGPPGNATEDQGGGAPDP
jgi:hypothetical protein